MELWSEGGALLLLAGTLFLDIKYRRISVRWLLLNGVFALLAAYLEQRQPAALAAGLLPGAALLLVAAVTRERVGKGDAGTAFVLGLYLGLWGCLTVLLLACALLALYGGCMLALRRVSPKRAVIFTPFLCGAYAAWRVLCLTGGA